MAVDGMDLEIAPGEIFGFLGPNGAGKTTTIRMLATLLRPHSGTARVFGHNVVGESDAVRDRVSYNPITHLVSAIRGLMSGTMPAGHISWLLVGCAVLVAVFAPITVRLYRNKE